MSTEAAGYGGSSGSVAHNANARRKGDNFNVTAGGRFPHGVLAGVAPWRSGGDRRQDSENRTK